jgi:hypothetical protein
LGDRFIFSKEKYMSVDVVTGAHEIATEGQPAPNIVVRQRALHIIKTAGEIARLAAPVFAVSAQEQTLRAKTRAMATGDAFVNPDGGTVAPGPETSFVGYAAQVSQNAMLARIVGRYAPGGNRLIAYTLKDEDYMVSVGYVENGLRYDRVGLHTPAAKMAGHTIVASIAQFSLHSAPTDRNTLLYLNPVVDAATDSPLTTDGPYGNALSHSPLRVGVPEEHLEAMQLIDRADAADLFVATGQLALPQVQPVYHIME